MRRRLMRAATACAPVLAIFVFAPRAQTNGAPTRLLRMPTVSAVRAVGEDV